MKFYSEGKEDKWLYEKHLLPNAGVYVDIGAAHPTRMSNTALLRDIGWRGIHIDADPYWIPYWEKKGLKLLNHVVWTDNEGTKFEVNKEAHRISRVSRSGKEVPTRTLNSIFEEHNIEQIGLMSLDVEGIEYNVFLTLDRKYWPRILIFEYDTLGEKDYRLQDYLWDTGEYKQIHKTSNNFIFYKTNRTYDYHRTCWRYKFGKVGKNEEHPCYICGKPIPLKHVDKLECGVCGVMICPNCHNCLCTLSDQDYNTLIHIHKNYCCNLDKFDGTIELTREHSLHIGTNFLQVLNKCKEYEGL